MKPTPAILGAITLAITAGTALGMSTPTDPLTNYSDTLSTLPQHAMESRSSDAARKMIAPRDQYPLETPEGVIEVSELAYHGRLRNRMREQPLYGATSEAEAFAMSQDLSTSDYRRYERSAALDAQQPDLSATRDRDVQRASTQQNLPQNFVPLESGIFENTGNSRVQASQEEANRRDRFARRDANLAGKARTINVQAELALRN